MGLKKRFTDLKEIEIEVKRDRGKGRDWWQGWDGGKEIIFCSVNTEQIEKVQIWIFSLE